MQDRQWTPQASRFLGPERQGMSSVATPMRVQSFHIGGGASTSASNAPLSQVSPQPVGNSSDSWAPTESFWTARHKDRPKASVSQLSFYKSTTAGGATGHSAGGSKKFSDPRNIGSDKFKKEAITTIIRWMAFSGFKHPLTFQDLKNPTKTTLVAIWNHIFKGCIDNSVEVTKDNADQEVPKLFKGLGYPLTISKSAMLAPNTNHQWPHHLAALHWLCELLIYESEVFPGIAEGFELMSLGETVNEPGTMTQRNVAKLVVDYYREGAHGKDFPAIQDLISERLEADLQLLREVVDQKNQKCSDLQAELEALKEELIGFLTLQPKLEMLEKDTTNIETRLNNGLADIAAKENQLESCNAKSKKLEEESEAVEKKCAEFRKTIKEQGVDKVQFMDMQKEVAVLKEVLCEKQREIDEKTKSSRKMAEENSNELKMLREVVRKLKHLSEDCDNLSPKRGSKENERSWRKICGDFNIDSNCTTLNGLLGVDWGVTKKTLISMMEEDKTDYEQFVKASDELERQIGTKKGEITGLGAATNREKRKLQIAEEDIASSKDNWKKEREVLCLEGQQHEEDVRKLKDQVAAELTSAQQDLSALDSKRQSDSQCQREEATKKLQEVHRMKELLIAHKKNVTTHFQQLAEEKENTLHAFLELSESVSVGVN